MNWPEEDTRLIVTDGDGKVLHMPVERPEGPGEVVPWLDVEQDVTAAQGPLLPPNGRRSGGF